MPRIRTLAVLASIGIAVGGAGLARAETSTLAASQRPAAPTAPTGTAAVTCTVAPSSVAVGGSVTGTDTSPAPTGGATITGYSFDWGDGTHSPQAASKTATHTYTAAGTFVVNETIYGTFGPDGHETDECTGSPVKVGPGTPPTTDPPACKDDAAGCPDKVDCKEADDKDEAECKKSTTTTTEKPECNNDETTGCPDKVDCKEADDSTEAECKPATTTTTITPCPGGEQRVIFHGKLVCEFDFATFYSAESGPMKIVVDASAVNGPSTNKSGKDPLPGDKVIDPNCADTLNSCNAVTNRDSDHDITKYQWDFVAWRADANNQPQFVEKHSVDSGVNPQAAVQFTKTQGDDVVQITLTITEGAEGTATVGGPKPVFPISRDGTANAEDLSPNVIIEPCDQAGLVLPATIGDTLIDGGIPLNEPNANGALSSAILQGTIGTPLAPVGQEVACLINVLPGV